MKRDPRLKKLSWDHHHGLVMSLRIERALEDPLTDIGALYADLLAFWAAGLLPHFRVETECLLARLIRHLPDSHESVRRTQDDHLGMAALVATMRDTTDASVRRETLAQFGTALKDHIRWEELVLFQHAQDELASAELDALEVEVEAALER
ncbi:MAG: hemerythrin domain-containing protein [Dehalococcoidia bacterium]